MWQYWLPRSALVATQQIIVQEGRWHRPCGSARVVMVVAPAVAAVTVGIGSTPSSGGSGPLL